MKPVSRVDNAQMHAHLICLALLLFASPLDAQSVSMAAVPILQAAVLPMYPPIAQAAHVVGKVTVRVTVRAGLVIETDVLSGPSVASGGRLLESPTLENLKSWRFAGNVNGVWTVAYTYAFAGTETAEPTNAKVSISPSLNVQITARPVKPTVIY